MKNNIVKLIGLATVAIVVSVSAQMNNTDTDIENSLFTENLEAIAVAGGESESKCNYVKKTNSSCVCKGSGTITCPC